MHKILKELKFFVLTGIIVAGNPWKEQNDVYTLSVHSG